MSRLTETQILDNRAIVISEMMNRRDDPSRGVYHDGECSYCGVGFMLEVYRFHAKDKVLCWSYLNDNTGHLLTNYIGIDNGMIKAGSWEVRTNMMGWLGIDLAFVDNMIEKNDQYDSGCTWDDLATMLKTASYYSGNVWMEDN